MKHFEQEQITGTQAFIEKRGYPQEITSANGREVRYYVLPQALNPNLPDFALRLTGPNAATGAIEGIFGVSDSVPEKLRPYWAQHEMEEFTGEGLGIERTNRCAMAEVRVLSDMPEVLRIQYVQRRIPFFQNVRTMFADDVEKGLGNYTAEDIVEADTVLRTLHSLLQQEGSAV